MSNLVIIFRNILPTKVQIQKTTFKIIINKIFEKLLITSIISWAYYFIRIFIKHLFRIFQKN